MLIRRSSVVFRRGGLLAVGALALVAGTASAQGAESRYADACDDGDLAACTLLGLMYERGAGVQADPGRAASLYEAACEGGQLRACTNLGLLFEAGRGVGRNPVRAATLYRQVCTGGEPMGCDLLAAIERSAATGTLGQFRKTGQVEDAESGDALADAVIEVPSLGLRVVSDAAGRVDLGRLPEGAYGVVAERFGYESVTGEVEVPGNADFVIQLFRASVADPLAPGRIVGRVVDEGGQGLANVEVVGGESGVRVLSGGEGRFVLDRVPGGLLELRFTHLGYETRSTHVVLQPGGTVEMSVNLATRAIELAPIEVTVRSRYLERSGFYRRAQMGWGTHFSPDDIARIDPSWVSDLLRGRVPGVRVVLRPDGGAYAESRRGISPMQGPCALPIYVDGMPAFDNDLDRIPPSWVEAMEVYHGAGTPIEYGGCGVILIWTNR